MLLLFILILSAIFPGHLSAANEFNISQNIKYSVNNQGITFVHQEINLSNNYSQIYAKEYQINLSGSNIQNVKGSDKNGNIIDKVDSSGNITNIFLKFKEPVIGKDQTNQFFVEYSISDFAQKKGNTWELQFPAYSNFKDSQQINITLEIPVSFGELSFSSIPINNTHILGDLTQIRFNQSQLNKGKILLVFGNHQLFDFKLNYYLQNNQNIYINTEIPIPPDTDNQTIVIQKIEPQPSNIITDSDGNWLAQFSIPANQSINVSVIGQAKIHPPQQIESTEINPGLLASQDYWPTDDPQLIKLALSLKTPRQIYKYIVNTLTYNYNLIDTAKRKGALYAFNHPDQSLCTEFTDLFVTLARINKIPAREIEGFAFSNNSKIKPTNTNSDVLHAWPEYFDQDKQIWTQIDPTWEKTTNGIDYFSDLDLNHIAFVIHGLESDYPPPPGSYKKDKISKTVFVDFASKDYKPEFVPPTIDISGNKLTIKNSNLFSIHPQNLTITGINWQPQLTNLPPFGSIEINLPKLNFFQSLHPDSKHFQVTISIKESDSPLSYSLVNKQYYLNLSICIGIIIFLLCLGGIILTISSNPNEKNS